MSTKIFCHDGNPTLRLVAPAPPPVPEPFGVRAAVGTVMAAIYGVIWLAVVLTWIWGEERLAHRVEESPLA